MSDDQMGPDRLVPKGLPAARRGYDRDAVERLLRGARQAWTALEAEHRRLLAEIEHTGGLDYLARDLGAVGAEVGRLLGDAQTAARGLRERAGSDAAQRLEAAAAEARRLVAEAEAQAFQLRADAWAGAESLLRQAEELHRKMVAEAEAEVLLIRADAEQEAYRMVSGARREAQEVLRGARFEAERTVLELSSQPERILPVDPIPVEPEPAPPTPPAGRLRRRRDTGEVPAVAREEVIRVIQPPEARRLPSGTVDPGSYGDALAAEVEALRVSGEFVVAPLAPPEERIPADTAPAPAWTQEPSPVAGEDAARDGLALAEETIPEKAAVQEETAEGDEGPVAEGAIAVGSAEPAIGPKAGSTRPGAAVDHLFARLRGSAGRSRLSPAEEGGGAAGGESAAAEGAPAAPAGGEEDGSTQPPGPDALARRERLLLPVQNRALRRAKEAIVELQNLALDALRVSGSWEAADEAASALGKALDPVAEEGAEAGAAAAGEFTGGEAPAPVISARSSQLTRAMAAELVSQVQAAVLGAAGAGPLEVAGSVTRVFRAWRSEGAERWVRAVAYAAYHDSLLAGLTVSGVARVRPVAAGLLCAQCPAGRGEVWDPAERPPVGTSRPPVHPDCVCTVEPA